MQGCLLCFEWLDGQMVGGDGVDFDAPTTLSVCYPLCSLLCFDGDVEVFKNVLNGVDSACRCSF